MDDKAGYLRKIKVPRGDSGLLFDRTWAGECRLCGHVTRMLVNPDHVEKELLDHIKFQHIGTDTLLDDGPI